MTFFDGILETVRAWADAAAEHEHARLTIGDDPRWPVSERIALRTGLDVGSAMSIVKHADPKAQVPDDEMARAVEAFVSHCRAWGAWPSPDRFVMWIAAQIARADRAKAERGE